MLLAIQEMDAAVLLWIQNHLRIEWLDPLVKFFTSLGNAGLAWIILTGLLLCFRKTRRAGMYSALALIFGTLFTNLMLKPLVSRARPYETLEALMPLVISRDLNSFPSGHTCAAFSAGIAWSRTLPRKWLRITAVVQAFLMGISRLYAGVHYPTDVLVGMAVGIFSGVLALWIGGRAEKKGLFPREGGHE